MASKLFRTGKKKVYLPQAVITLLRPRESQPANFATFKVPLRFNKLDLRDYLQHAYNVGVLGVRAQVTQREPREMRQHWRKYRPQPIKTMTVELRRPFTWPAVPEDLTPWSPPHLAKRDKTEKENKKMGDDLSRSGYMSLRDERPVDEGRRQLRTDAKEVLAQGRWENGKTPDPRFTSDRTRR
ncbi:hypothetical protein GGR52DRAFT_444711 [Hypoxylon sp. FL1284]|nr:hypothetical protein GGR52DRAFT_444711 [Hypoxylon sp. FL1284]